MFHVDTKRRLRDSKDEIVDRLIMPFVNDATAIHLIKPTHIIHTPKIGIRAFYAGAFETSKDKKQKQSDRKEESNGEKHKKSDLEEVSNGEKQKQHTTRNVDLKKTTSVEMLAAVNMISHR